MVTRHGTGQSSELRVWLIRHAQESHCLRKNLGAQASVDNFEHLADFTAFDARYDKFPPDELELHFPDVERAVFESGNL